MSAYSDAVQVDSPYAYFEDASAAPWNDVEGGNDITITGATANQTGPLASGDTKAFSFDGTDDFGQVALDLSDTSTITVEFWLWWDAFANGFDMALEFTADGTTNTGGFQICPDWNTGEFNIGHSGVNRKQYTRPSAAAWHHYAIVFDFTQNAANEVTAYLDGGLWTAAGQDAATDNASGTVYANSTLNVMCRNGASLFGAGDMAHLAIYKTALSAARILAHFEAADDLPPATHPPIVRPRSPRFRVVLDGEDVSPYLDQLAYTNVDPGGFEACTLTFPRRVKAPRGAQIRVEEGVETVFQGRVAEGQPVFSTTVQGEGAGAKLRDGRMREIYRDIDLGAWQPPSASRAQQLLGFSPSETGSQWNVSVDNDPEGTPAVHHSATRLFGDASVRGRAESWYGDGQIPLGSLAYTFDGYNTAAADWATVAFLATEPSAINFDTGTDHDGTATAVSATLTATTATRLYAILLTQFAANLAATDGHWDTFWTNVAVYGRHGLTLRGAEPAAGFYPSDIARDALRRVSGIREGVIETASGLVVPHSVYKTPVPHETVVDDMARLVGWHWGVWGPLSVLDDTPTLDFRSLPTAPTCFCAQADMDGEPDLSERLSDLYDTVQVSWQDPAGTGHVTERTAALDELAEAELSGRVLAVDLGLSSEAAAGTFGDYVLALQRNQARASGQVVLPGELGTPAGRKPAHLLKAGLDRLAVTDLPASGPLLDGTGRVAFHVRRVEVTVGREGVQTSVDLDSGANLILALTEQIQLATQVAA